MKSELRKDFFSGEWVIFSPDRAKRPEEFVRNNGTKKTPKSKCSFENIEKVSGGFPSIVYGGKNWKLQIVPNKYPALSINAKRFSRKSHYDVINGYGYHDLLITKDHDKNFSKLSKTDSYSVFRAFQERYLMIQEDKDVEYVSIFHNWGEKAGASVYHPHYQILSLPIVPRHIQNSLSVSKKYFKDNNKCIHCVGVKWERQEKSRIIFENKEVIAFTPFVSRSPFEIRIFPKKHLSFFEDTNPESMKLIVEALQEALKKLEKTFKTLDYNFFIHTSPLKNKSVNNHYHWHIEIKPKLSISAGFELGTGLEINIIDPDKAAKFIRNGNHKHTI